VTSMSVRFSVCQASISPELHDRSSPIVCPLPVAVARSSSGGVALFSDGGKLVVKYTHIALRSLTCYTATGTHTPYGITQCYLPPDRGDIPAFTPAEAGTR